MSNFLFRRKKQEKDPRKRAPEKAKKAARKQEVGDICGDGNTIINGDVE